jgi:hypothetical protein
MGAVESAPESSMQSSKEPRDFKPVWWTVQHTIIWQEHLPALRAHFERVTADRERERATHLGADEPLFQRHAVAPRNVDVEHAHAVPDNDWEVGTTWEQIEAGVRYGVGARTQYSQYERWNRELEARLRQEWEETHPPSTWEKMKRAVRHGFEATRKKLS